MNVSEKGLKKNLSSKKTLFCLILVLLLVGTVSATQITEEQIEENNEIAEQGEEKVEQWLSQGGSCSDTDGGKDYYTRGIVTAPSGNTYTDYCYTSLQIKEYFCDGTTVKSIKATRTGYECKSGKLVKVSAGCTDTDGGKDYYTRATVTAPSGNTYTDYCYTSLQVKEYFCDGTTVKSIKASRSGYECTGGKLVKETVPLPDCDEGDTETLTCPDGSTIIVKECVNGKWVDTGNQCPDDDVPPDVCIAGYYCKDIHTEGYRLSDCTWDWTNDCPYGCDETKGICKISTIETECDDGKDNDGDGKYDCNDPDCYGDPACDGKEGYFIENNECIHTIDKDKIQYDTLEECKKDLENGGLPVWLLLLIVLVVFGGLGTAIYFAARKR